MNPLDDNKAYFDTTAWLQRRTGQAEPDADAEVRVITDLFFAEDSRLDPDHSLKRHSPVFTVPFSTTCEICRQPIYKNSDMPSGYGVYMNRNEML